MDTKTTESDNASQWALDHVWIAIAAALVFCTTAVFGQANVSAPMVAAALLQKSDDLKSQLAGNPFNRPLVLESSESSNRVEGNVYAVLESSFAAVSRTFKSPDNTWC